MLTGILAIVGVVLMTLNLLSITNFSWAVIIALMLSPVWVPLTFAGVCLVIAFIVKAWASR